MRTLLILASIFLEIQLHFTGKYQFGYHSFRSGVKIVETSIIDDYSFHHRIDRYTVDNLFVFIPPIRSVVRVRPNLKYRLSGRYVENEQFN